MFRSLLFFLFLQFSLHAQHELSICAIFQDEAPYFKEWIEFHKLQGVEHFYLYNNNSTDDFRKVLQPYIDKHEVTLTDWLFTYDEGAHADWISIQAASYMDCMQKYGSENRWIAIIDTDEFLFSPNGKKLPSILKEYKEYGGVSLNWVRFGTSEIEDIPPGDLLIEHLTRCSFHEDRENRLTKTIVQPKYVSGCVSAHYFIYIAKKYAVDTDHHRVKSGNYSRNILLDKMRINHYWTRTAKCFREKKLRSRQKRRPAFTLERLTSMVDRCNEHRDTAIFRFVKKLKRAMREK